MVGGAKTFELREYLETGKQCCSGDRVVVSLG